MCRTEKYKLDRILIELENAVQDLVDYCHEKIFEDMFDDPVSQIDSWFNLLPKKYKEAPCRKTK